MNHLALLLTIAYSLVSGSLLAQDEIIGVWDTGEGRVEIHQTEEGYIGNPIDTSGVRRDEIQVLTLTHTRNKWNGKIYSIKKDKRMNVECRIKEEQLHLRVKAGMIKRTLKWTRVQ
ncbi:MAG: hypothetical protein AAFW89_09635 [Bacteroidota bacterium]